jgi:quercetin dioxygenase-like cupin family protein
MKEIKIVRSNQNQKVSADWGNLTWYANAALGNSDQMTVGKCVIKPGHENPLHSHPNCYETLVVTDGSIEHMVENGRYEPMAVGDTITVPANVKHNARNTGKTDAVLFITFSSSVRETKGE